MLAANLRHLTNPSNQLNENVASKILKGLNGAAKS